MPDAHGRFRGISIPALPWVVEDKRPPKKANDDKKTTLK